MLRVELYADDEAVMRVLDPFDYAIASNGRDYKLRCGFLDSLMVKRINPDR